MAIIKGALQMTGGIRGVSFYTITGSDKVIMRTKGGPKARRMKLGEEFEKVRKHQSEWAGCVKFARSVGDALGEIYRLADYNVWPVLCGMGKNLMSLDTEHPVGQRNLMLSQYRKVLDNFSLNRNYQFNSVLRITPEFEIDKVTLNAQVRISQINTEMDLLNIQKLPYFRVIVTLGIVSDVVYVPDEKFNIYEPVNESTGSRLSTISEWFSTEDIINEQTLSVKLDEEVLKMTDDVTVLLGIGVEFGKVSFAGQIAPVKHAGSGKVLAVR
jgi:hypothetical protein